MYRIHKTGATLQLLDLDANEDVFGEVRVPLQLQETSIALIKKVVFHPFSNQGQVNNSEGISGAMFLSARTDDAFQLPSIDEYDTVNQEDSLIASWRFSLIAQEDNLGGVGSLISYGCDIPDPYFPVVGDMTLKGCATLRGGNNQNFKFAVEVYYIHKQVSAVQWLGVAKRQRNAPRDLSEPSVFNT